MSDGVTVRLTEDGPIRYNGGGIMVDRGDEATTNADHAAYLVDNHGFEYVDEPEGDDEYTCAGNGGECSRVVDEEGGYCWQHG